MRASRSGTREASELMNSARIRRHTKKCSSPGCQLVFACAFRTVAVCLGLHLLLFPSGSKSAQCKWTSTVLARKRRRRKRRPTPRPPASATCSRASLSYTRRTLALEHRKLFEVKSTTTTSERTLDRWTVRTGEVATGEVLVSSRLIPFKWAPI